MQKNISARKDAKVPGTSKQFATEDTEGINDQTIKGSEYLNREKNDQGVRVLEPGEDQGRIKYSDPLNSLQVL